MASGLLRAAEDLQTEAHKVNNTVTTVEWKLAEIARPYLGSCDLSVSTFAEISQLDIERSNLAQKKCELDGDKNKINDSVLFKSQNVMKKITDIQRIVGLNKN